MLGLESTLSLEDLTMCTMVRIQEGSIAVVYYVFATKRLLCCMLTKSMETFVSANAVLIRYAFTNWISNPFALDHPRRRGCSGGTCSRWRSAGDAVEEKDYRCPGHGWCLHTDCVRSAQNCKLCFSTAGYYPQPILFSCSLVFATHPLFFSPTPLLPPSIISW